MKILQINSAKAFGGGEKHLVDLCKGLQNQGNEIFLAVRPNNQWEEKLDFVPKENLTHISLRNSADIFSAKKIAEFVRENKIAVIHAHVARDYPLAALASRLSKTPLVLSRHLTYKLNTLHRLTFKQANKIIAVSNGVAESLKDFADKEKLIVVYNGVDISEFQNIEKNPELIEKFGLSSNLVIATIGELREHKGQEDFIRAAGIVAEKYKDVKFLIIGKDNSNSQEYRMFLEDLVERLNLQNKIIFAGWQNKMTEIYALTDIFVSSARSEPFGLVIAEAMATGKAIVATKTFGAAELLQDNENGKLVSIKNIEGIAEAIIKFLDDESLRLKFGKSAQIRAKEFFSLEKMVLETEKVYHSII
jgi:glycosyltransferase involved in cell wall biosynthesis